MSYLVYSNFACMSYLATGFAHTKRSETQAKHNDGMWALPYRESPDVLSDTI